MKIRQFPVILLCLAACLSSCSVFGESLRLEAVEWGNSGTPQLRLALNGTPRFRLLADGPTTLTIELTGVELAAAVRQPPGGHAVARRLTASLRGQPRRLRLQVQLARHVPVHASIASRPGGSRLIISWNTPSEKVVQSAKPLAKSSVALVRATRRPAVKARDSFIVAIDAGHGGKDTGAIGPRGTYEKDVVLAIARRLAGFIHAAPGMRAVMVRSGDRFVGLGRRTATARRLGADLFVSIHADADPNSKAQGTSVFVRADRHASQRAGGKVLSELRKDMRMHHHALQPARFMVLSPADMPSMLVETGFISNPVEESRLRDPRHQAHIARAIFNGIHRYFAARRSNRVTVADAGDSLAGRVSRAD